MQMQAKKGCKKRQSEVENYGNVRIFAKDNQKTCI